MTEYLMAERGSIYEWANNNKPYDYKYNLALVISSNKRSRDKLVSILFLSTDRGDYSDDIIRFEFNHKTWVVHTDLITYTQRGMLINKLGQLPENIMKTIDKKLVTSLGLKDTLVDWETMYNNLLSNVIERRA